MTPEQIAAARALVDAATPGPVAVRHDDHIWSTDEMTYIATANRPVDADFIAWCFNNVPAFLDALAAAEARAARAELEADNWSSDYRALEKAVCGDTGLSAMLIATQAMLFKPRAEAAEARAADLTAKLEAMTERKRFPILGGQGASVDWQLVADHGKQAMSNHGQTVAGLAGRGGLSWCELFAVLHDQRWKQIDTKEAVIACRALEARYLAALKAGGAA